MQIQRVSNAGVLLTLDGVLLLLDGVCQGYSLYLTPPPAILQELEHCPPDALAFTHSHPDHFEAGFAARFYDKTRRPVLGTAEVAERLPAVPVEQGSVVIGGVRITPIPSRHLGVEWRNYPHVSYLLEGSRRIFYVGDATPACWKDTVFQLRPDVLIAPYPYVTTRFGWQSVERFAPKAVVVVHMPAVDNDPDGIWSMVQRGMAAHRDIPMYVPDLGEKVFLV